MALKKEDLLKFSKNTELAIKLIEDDSSEKTTVKILHLVAAVQAVGSIPTSEGGEMRVQGAKVYVASDDIDKMLEDCNEKDGIIVYKGQMHLDVSKPNGRMVNGQFVITKPAKIWLTGTKFARGGGQLRQDQANNLNGFIGKMFNGGKVLDLATESATAGNAANAGGPTVVANVTKEAVTTED